MVFLAALIRGFTGFGFGITAVPLLSLVLPPAQAIPIVLMLQVVVSGAGLPAAMRLCDWPSIRMLTVGAALATPAGVWGLAHIPANTARLTIAGLVLAAVAVIARGFRLRSAPRAGGVLGFGIVSGLCNGLVGIPGPPVIALYMASPVPTAVARASMIVFFLITAVLGLIPAAWFGLVGWTTLIASAGGTPVVWFGSAMGAWLYRLAPPKVYRIVGLSMLVLTATLALLRVAIDR